MGSKPPLTPSRFAAYQSALKAISARTGTPLPSLIVSFGILHELTAILPIVGLFHASRSLGLGERMVNAMASAGHDDNQPSQPSKLDGSGERSEGVSWMVQKGQAWVDEGEKWAARVGRRYGMFGFEKRAKGDMSQTLYEEDSKAMKGHIAGDVANVVVAYAATKALLPLRIGASLYLSPAFSRRAVEPCRQWIIRSFRKS
ncbi:hypothetical protein PC9H_007995 [Pleurotus ostreatus]|uniref:Uncharacterized protein n=1 Tax=Pleurotus ostreatus TaxID=5322 RepID=A0A8H7DUS6_PLEOS|nr:uncharacterized protein PC9H_007995 [Pleurotus ostreatus]KAF7428763.1 hypothetical protein PC9H_007995 [Pleurotus ostreatus]KAJ8696969.1 hypothetical protein PTI98_006788 [Pleurotus ostreatus]